MKARMTVFLFIIGLTPFVALITSASASTFSTLTQSTPAFLAPHFDKPPEDSAYFIQNAIADAGKLPWKCGDQMQVTQDRDNPSGSHYGSDRWAWDFGNGATGWPIYAAHDGIVAIVETGYSTGSGCITCDWRTANRVVVDHGNGTAGLYMHLAREYPPRLVMGDPVRAGVTIIGNADKTGRLSGPHLHYAIQQWDSAWNGQAGTWYKPSIESLFGDSRVPGGNPLYPNWYPSGNCPDAGSPQLTLHFGSQLKNRAVTIELRRSSGFGQLLDPVFSGTATTDANGTISNLVLSNVTPNTYSLRVKPHSWLQTQVNPITLVAGPNPGFDLSTRMIAGDIDGNNKVNIVDYRLFLANFGSVGCGNAADFNGNCTVDIFDYNMIVSAYGKAGDGGEIVTGSGTLSSGRMFLAPLGQGTSYRQPRASAVGDVITLSLGFDTAELQMTAASAIVDYDHCVLELQSDQITNSGVFNSNTVITSTGTVEYIGSNSTVSGTGSLINMPFKVIAGSPVSTNVAVRFRLGSTYQSNMLTGTSEPFLGSVVNSSIYASGIPQRSPRMAQVTSPAGGVWVNQNAIILMATASDTCNGNAIKRVTFYVFYDGQWHQIGTGTADTNSWSLYWDASQVADQVIKVKVFASDMAGNGVESSVSDNIVLDRQPPVLSSLAFDPLRAWIGQSIRITINTADNLAGVKRADIYIDPSTNGSGRWPWNLIGSINGGNGTVVWNSAGYTVGSHQVILLLEDNAGNQIFWPLPGGSPIAYELSDSIFLPIILK